MTSSFKGLFALLCFCMVLPFTLSAQSSPPSAAQGSHWVQLEAHATLRTAEEFAARYDARFGSVAGFRLNGGWYALAIGPYESEADALAVRDRLVAAREIRPDAYVTDGSIYAQQFWPAGGAPLAPPSGVQVEPPRRDTATPEAAVQLPAVTEGNPAASTEATAPEETASADTAPAAGTTETQPEPQAEAQPVPEAIPVPVADLETVAEARNRERDFTRDQRAEIQTALQWFGFYTQRVDAAFGPGTRNSIGNWQSAQGFEASGFLTGRQHEALLASYAAALARYDFRPLRDEAAGVEITLPFGMVNFDRHESPFAHFREVNGSSMRVLLLSQEGNQATLFGLYEIMQTLSIIPMDGQRERRNNGFLITGRSDTMRAHVEARLENGQIKGWALLWSPAADADATLVLETMRSSFRSIPGVLPGDLGAGASSVPRGALIAGLEVRRPVRARSGFFSDAVGTVVTSTEAVAQCSRVTIDEAYDARVSHSDATNGIAILTPVEPLVPLAFAQFTSQPPQLNGQLRLSGFSFQDTLTRPILTLGQLSGLTGINGEEQLRRLTLTPQEGDIGGPVFDATGAVMGMLVPDPQLSDRILPEDVAFAASSGAIMAALEAAGRRGTLSRENANMAVETLTRVSADLTVLVSCWE